MFSEERDLFKKWLSERQHHFDEVGAAPADIAYIALQDGHNLVVVREWEAHQRWENMGKAS